MVRLFREAAPLQEQQQPLVPGRLARADDRLGTGADVVPDLRPDLTGRPAQRPGVLRAEGHPGVGVVVEEGEIRPPAQPHGVPGVEHDPHDRLEALRPAGDRPHRRLRPVEATGPLAHLAATGQKCERVVIRHSMVALAFNHAGESQSSCDRTFIRHSAMSFRR